MGIKKALLISVSTIGTIGVVSGAGVGIAHAVQQNQSQSEVMEHVPGTKPIPVRPGEMDNKNPGSMNDTELNDDPSKLPPTEHQDKNQPTLAEVIKNLTENDLSIYEIKDGKLKKEKEVTKTNVVAYKIKPTQLELKDTTRFSLQSNSIKVELNTTKNTIVSLNEGNVHFIVSTTDPMNMVKKEVTISGFKTPKPSGVSNLFNESKLGDNEKYSLTLNPKSEAKTKWVSLEDLNKDKVQATVPKKQERDASVQEQTTKEVSGLTAFLWESTLSSFDLSKVEIKGSVKLDNLEKDSSKNVVNFDLVSNDATNPLRIVVNGKKPNEFEEEVLVQKIRTNNLLATSITFDIEEVDAKGKEEFLAEIKKESNSDRKGYSIKDEENDATIAVKLSGKSGSIPANEITLHPYKLNQKEEQNAPSVKLAINVHFGSGKSIKTYSTKSGDNSTQAVLEKAGFKFNVYSKKLTNSEVVPNASVISDVGNMLNNYFKQEKYSTPSQDPLKEKMADEVKKSNGGFYITKVSDIKTLVGVDVKKSSAMSESPDADKKPFNLLVFADYSYLGVGTDMVLYTSDISLVHATAPVEKA